MIEYQPELIHEEKFIMGIMNPWAAEFPPFQDYLDHKTKQQNTNYLKSTSTTKEIPLKELRKDMLSPTYQDKNNSTEMLEDLGVVSATRWVQELMDPKKATYPLMSEYGAD